MSIESNRLRRALCLLGATLVFCTISACDDSENDTQPDATGDADSDADTDGVETDTTIPTGGIADCDSLQDAACSLPWPSNYYLADDSSTVTGKRLEFRRDALPQRRNGMLLDGSSWSRLDGYGVSTPILFVFENIDLTGLASELDMSPSVESSHPIHLYEVQGDDSLEMVRFWLEYDSQDTTPEDGLIWMRPAKVLEEGTRYIVTIGEIKDTSGDVIPADADFAALRDANPSSRPRLGQRVDAFEDMFGLLSDAGIQRDSLTLAWDFNTASSETLHGSMLQIRDLTMEATGDDGPAMTFDEIEEFSCEEGVGNYDSGIAYRMDGTFDAPYFMRPADDSATNPLALPSVFNKNADGDVEQNGIRPAAFHIMVPCSAVGPDAEPAGIIQYGHGLLGGGGQVYGGFNKRIASEYNYIFFAGDWTGMSYLDLGVVGEVILDVSKFAYLADRLHQGISEFLSLGSAMQNVFGDAQEITSREIKVNADEYYYSGISQGGIFGGTFVAVSPDVKYGHLGVPGINYSTLLHRSTDFDLYLGILRGQLEDPIDQGIAVTLIQQLWDQTDPASYYKHLSTDPFPGNEPSYVLLAPAKGDYQVSPLTNLVAANSDSGVAIMSGWGDDIAHVGLTEQSYGTPEAPYVGSAVVMFDLGNPWPQPGNTPPVDSAFCWEQRGMPASGECLSETDCRDCDPHGIPRSFPELQTQMIHFFENDGEVIDVCGGNGCVFRRDTAGWGGDFTEWTDQ